MKLLALPVSENSSSSSGTSADLSNCLISSLLSTDFAKLSIDSSARQNTINKEYTFTNEVPGILNSSPFSQTEIILFKRSQREVKRWPVLSDAREANTVVSLET